MINYLTLDGKPSLDFGLIISGAGTMNSPQKRYEEIDIPGRNGKLLRNTDNFFDNVELSYESFVYENGDFISKHMHKDSLDTRTLQEKMRALREYLGSRNGYMRIEDTYNPEEYRLGYFAGPLQAEIDQHLKIAQFTLTFMCKPQRFLKDGEIPTIFHKDASMLNYTMFSSKPLIHCVGTRGYKSNPFVRINGVTVRIDDYTLPYVDIDCDLMEVTTENNTSINSKTILINGEFPVLKPGNNDVLFGNFEHIEITPNWWTL